MKELLHSLPDGANDFGNGVIGPSLSDIRRANATLSFENLRARETRTKDNRDIICVSSESRLGRFFKEVIGRVPKRLTIPVGTGLSLVAVTCSGGGDKNTVENNKGHENEESSGHALPFPKGETWFLTTGPHGDGYSRGVKYAIDIAPPEGGFCPKDGRKFTIGNRVVTASASGTVTVKGDDNDRNDPFHSVVDIKDKTGLTLTYMHLDNTKKVKVGKKVKQGDPLGNPSCEFPPGGGNTGPHVHVGVMKDGQAIPIDGVKIGGWTIHNGADGKEGTMTKPGEKTRTASTGRYGENSTGIRNDLPNNPNRAVVASPKDAIPPISGSITSKEVFAAPATPTPKPTETPKPTPTVEKPVEVGWTRFRSSTLPYQIDYPSNWEYLGLFKGNIPNAESDTFTVSKNPSVGIGTTRRLSTPAGYTLNDYKDDVVNELRQLNADGDMHWIDPVSVHVDGQKGWKIESTTANFHYVGYIFIYKGQAWEVYLEAKHSIFDQELPGFQKMLASFKLLQSTETPKPAVEKKVSLSKKPDELYRALLTSPISPNVLPQGMSSRGASAGEIDATGKALKQVGTLTIKIEDSVSAPVRGVPTGGITYAIFPDSSTAKSASEIIGTHLGNGQVLKDFPYPAKTYTLNTFGLAIKMVVMSVENVTVIAIFTGTNPDLLESRAILLAHAAIEHLGKVGK